MTQSANPGFHGHGTLLSLSPFLDATWHWSNVSWRGATSSIGKTDTIPSPERHVQRQTMCDESQGRAHGQGCAPLAADGRQAGR